MCIIINRIIVLYVEYVGRFTNGCCTCHKVFDKSKNEYPYADGGFMEVNHGGGQCKECYLADGTHKECPNCGGMAMANWKACPHCGCLYQPKLGI
jgi:hypothetical protein